MNDHPEAWHLREVIVQAVITRDEDDGWFGFAGLEWQSDIEDMADQIIRVMRRYGYVVTPPAETDSDESRHQSVPGRMSFTVLEKG